MGMIKKEFAQLQTTLTHLKGIRSAQILTNHIFDYKESGVNSRISTSSLHIYIFLALMVKPITVPQSL